MAETEHEQKNIANAKNKNLDNMKDQHAKSDTDLNYMSDWAANAIFEDMNCHDLKQFIKTAYDPIKILAEIRKYPEQYHPITDQQYAEFYEDLDKTEYNPKYYQNAKKLVEDEGIKQIDGWNVGLILDKPYFVLSWIDKNNNKFVEFVVSTKLIETYKPIEVLALFVKNKILHISKNTYKTILFETNDQKDSNLRTAIITEGYNGKFFQIILKVKKHGEKRAGCYTQLFPTEWLMSFNKNQRTIKPKSQKAIRNAVTELAYSNAVEDLMTVRADRNKFLAVTNRQYLDPNSDDFAATIRNDNKCYPKERPNNRFLVGEFTLESVLLACKNASSANDDNSVDAIKKIIALFDERASAFRPNITVKKVLGWNAGYAILKKGYETPWFSTCWEDADGRIMMDALFCASKDLNFKSDNDVDDFCEENGIYYKNNNFIKVSPSEDSHDFTFYVDKIRENDNAFWRVIIMLQANKKSPKVCESLFCPNDRLTNLNSQTNILNEKFESVLTEKIKLTNDIIQKIDMSKVVLFYYNEKSKILTVIVKNEQEKLVETSKKTFVRQLTYSEYTGQYDTQELLPDNIMETFLGNFLNNKLIREENNTLNMCFAFDGLSGQCSIDDWICINLEQDHLFISPDFIGQFADKMLEFATRAYPACNIFNNYASDLRTCWKDMILDYERKSKIEVVPITSLEGIKLKDIIIMAQADGELPYVELATENKKGIQIYSSQSNPEITKKLNTIINNFSLYSSNNAPNGWKNYKDGSNKNIVIRSDYYRLIFTPTRSRRLFVKLKFKQNPNKFISILSKLWQSYFDQKTESYAIQQKLENGFKIDLGKISKQHLNSAASFEYKDEEITIVILEDGEAVKKAFGGAESVKYTITIDAINSKKFMKFFDKHIEPRIYKEFHGLDCRQKIKKFCDDKNITYEENTWTDYD